MPRTTISVSQGLERKHWTVRPFIARTVHKGENRVKITNKWCSTNKESIKKNWYTLPIHKNLISLSAERFSLSSVQTLSCIRLFATPWTAAHQAFLPITNSQSLLKLISSESVMPSNHLTLCNPLLPSPSIFPSIRVFSNESVLCIRWSKHWSFSFSIGPSTEYSGLISFRMDWLDLLACPRDSQESSPTPHPKSINSLVLSFLYSPTLTSIDDYWKNYSFD